MSRWGLVFLLDPNWMVEFYTADSDAVEGWVDECARGIVRGWARQRGAARGPLTVEVLVDGVSVGEGVANLMRPDLNRSGKGDCAFAIAIDPQRLPAAVVDATVRVRHGPMLPGGHVVIDVSGLGRERPAVATLTNLSRLPHAFGGDAGLEGTLDEFGPDWIAGWACDPDAPSSRVALEIWQDGRCVANLTAGTWRGDLEGVRQGDGRWGFSVPVPPALQDDAVHELDIRAAKTGRSLLDEPLRVHLPRREPVVLPAGPAPNRDEEDRRSSHIRPLDRPAPAETLFTVIVNFYNMQREAARTLTSLSRAYQREIGDLRYEVLCIDNGSDPPLDPVWIESFGPEFRLIRPSRVLPSPCAAINEAARMARGRYLAVMIDGAHVLTPGVFRAAWDALEEAPQAPVALRHWFVGGDQRWLSHVGYTRRQEDMLFDKIDWPRDGYELFRIGMPILESPNNWFDNMIESNCLFLSAGLYREIGGMNEDFSVAGAGFANLDLFGRAAEATGEPVVALLGEASFHQFHGGATTNVTDEEMERRVRDYETDYYRLLGRRLSVIQSVDLHFRGQFRVARARAATGRQKPLSPARMGVTDRIRPGNLPLHFDEGTATYAQSVYAEAGLYKTTKWLGQTVPVAPADLVNIQDIIHQTQPGRIVTVNAMPGLLGLLDSLLALSGLDAARIVSVGVAADAPPARAVTMAGDPLDPAVLAATARALDVEDSVLVLYAPLPGNHYPIEELRAYSHFVSLRSYLIFMGSVFGQPWLGYSKNWYLRAIRDLASDGLFAIDRSRDRHMITTCPMGFLQRIGGFASLADKEVLTDGPTDAANGP